MENLKKIFSVYIDPNGEPYLQWENDVPEEWKMMLRNAFAGQFKEIENGVSS